MLGCREEGTPTPFYPLASSHLEGAAVTIQAMRLTLRSAQQFLATLCHSYMIWKALQTFTESKYPVMAVVSESMAPGFHRGDLILLANRQTRIEVGDVPVIWFADQPSPMVHRAVHTHLEGKGNETVQHILTKGDNNEQDDIPLYPQDRSTALRNEVVGVVRGYVPYLGWLAIAPQEILTETRKTLAAYVHR